MVRSHAKNNTTQANLTHYERSLLRQAGAARRLGRDSFKPLDHCNLCLVRVTDPVACSQAHIYCRECALSSLITQKAGIDAQRRELERWEADDARRRSDAREAARARVVADFEKGMGLSSVRKAAVTASSAAASTDLAGEIERRQLEAEEKAAAAIEAEESEARKAKIAAFWLPSLTPEAPLGPLKAVKLQPLCSVGAAPHPFSRKTLLPVILNYPGGSDKPHCPSCAKELTNSSGGVLLSSREPGGGGDEPAKKKKKVEGKKDKKEKEAPAVCGHVVCKTCAETVVAPAKACPVCDAVVEAAGMLPLGKEGTGFAAAGGAEVKKATVAFRV